MNVYPSISELIPEVLQARLPSSLERDVVERYQSLGIKYLTEEHYFDGRAINSCMYKSSTQDALEEVIDAVFNVLVWLFKARKEQIEYMNENMWTVLLGLIEIYAILKSERMLEDDFVLSK